MKGGHFWAGVRQAVGGLAVVPAREGGWLGLCQKDKSNLLSIQRWAFRIRIAPLDILIDPSTSLPSLFILFLIPESELLQHN